MYDIDLKGVKNQHEYEELIKVFLRPSEYRINLSEGAEAGAPDGKNEIKRGLYRRLSGLTGKNPEWGILTGVRPVKLTGELYERLKEERLVRDALTDEYLLNAEKAELLISIYGYQREILKKPSENSVGVYIGIPFCPTRCLYCSFTSNQAPESKINEYMTALSEEIKFAGGAMRACRMKPETVYIGGGTPTTLTPGGLEKLLCDINLNFDLSELKEFTVEAGRPDTITAEKLRVIKNAGVSRISVNPQSMSKRTLEIIGRMHTPEDIREAFELARNEGFDVINMDVIAGLPGESAADFAGTVSRIAELAPENVTVHTLAVKRASRLIDVDREYHYEHGETVDEMLRAGRAVLSGAGYAPYYLYRQKHMTGGFENVGWCRRGTAGIYNIRIMEEAQTIVALGAGGISKVYYPEENRLERVPNVSNYELYISRLGEMLERKKEKLFMGRIN